LLCTIRRQIRKAAARVGHRPHDYACTLLAVAVDSSGRWIAVQLGDGGIVGRFGTEIADVSRSQKGEFANQTFFVTDPDAAVNLHVVGSGRNSESRTASGFALFTDGMEGSLVHRRTGRVAGAIPQMLGWFDGYPDAEVSAAIDRNIAEVFGPRTTDDCTLVIMVVQQGTSDKSAPSMSGTANDPLKPGSSPEQKLGMERNRQGPKGPSSQRKNRKDRRDRKRLKDRRKF
jgi:hypothetical protein